MTILTAAGSVAVAAACNSLPLKGSAWERTSYSGRTVSLSEGVAAGAGALVGTLGLPWKQALPSAVAIASAWIAGYVDDELEDAFPAKAKGFHGHLGALRHGKLTSGIVKIALIGAGSAIGAVAIPRSGGRLAKATAWAGQAALIAGSANLVNLLDLRPGRAVKTCGVVALPLCWVRDSTARSLAASALATSVACAPRDLRGETMLGDTGANALGSAVGLALARVQRGGARWAALAVIVALTALSEKVSFSRFIADHRILRMIDECGRP